ncbi:DE-cadherin [Agrilus planipennis]|uniref:DE-cadherin n=1 Tax=Agrilus planipennis TaxID=224129 RepID=A0A1W4X3Q7_AGRPL|nr:DE-cadherin [Agrilus planipennis]
MGNTRTLVKYLSILIMFASIPLGFVAQLDPFSDNSYTDQHFTQVTELPMGFNAKEMSSRIATVPSDSKDNHKPEFLDCANYKPSVLEEQERGTYVTKITAIDIDPKESGGTITYSIVKPDIKRQDLNIDNVTGVITTNVRFDRDEPSYQKEFYVTVKATDNGRPVLESDCTFKVTIEDINDNNPVFDKSQYNEQVVEDLKVDGEVMRVFAYDIDSGENARLTYSLMPPYSSGTLNEYSEFFRIDANTGVVYLKKSLVEKTGQIFKMQVVVRDNGAEPKEASTDVQIQVVSSDKQPPSFTKFPTEPIYLPENYNDVDSHIADIEAESNIQDVGLTYELIKGKTKQTNSDETFRITQRANTSGAFITVARALDYETVTEYQLTVRVTNRDHLSTSKTINIKITDVNDEIPTFIEIGSGSVLENEQPGAAVMQVRAIDKDGTSANNIVSYELQNYMDHFHIDKTTGKITTLQMFDREKVDFYPVIVVAKDNSPSALSSKNVPNSATQAFPIHIKDRNDNKPRFTKGIYIADNIFEDMDKGKTVIEVKALDPDTASLIIYSITKGNVGDAFYMENTTGRIQVNNKLDYEKIESYNLTVEANDGLYSDNATVIINIGNRNDEIPVFYPYEKRIRLREEEAVDGCILNIKAYDPDIKDRNADQRIVYSVGESQKTFIQISKDGCVTLIKPLDRDKPDGFPAYQVYIYASDELGGPGSLLTSTEFIIELEDINDNEPFLNVTTVVWYENQEPGDITQLTADDYDSVENGPPFTYDLAPEASVEIRQKFAVTTSGVLQALVTFDREVQKYYIVPIAVTDSGTPKLTGVSYMTVIIGDVNDNEAKDGYSEIFVYNYNGVTPDVAIGRIYVDDPDDWDLRDKNFQWSGFPNENFELNHNNGSIIMKQGTPEGVYDLKFIVTEEAPPVIQSHSVSANVTVTVKLIPEEAVRKSGSVRIKGIKVEDFIIKAPNSDSLSKKDILQNRLAKILNTSAENVDVFTVLTSPSNASLVDVRFSAHGSPYYLPEKLNAKLSQFQKDLQNDLGVEFVMININECLNESVCPSRSSCSNRLNIHEEPAVVFTNQTSFVGVQAIIEAVCDCLVPENAECLNGGTMNEAGVCNCLAAFEGPRCELFSVGFYSDGWAMYPPFESCNYSEIHLEITPQNDNGLVFYVGPMTASPKPTVRDFMSLELRDGLPLLLVDYGSGTASLYLDHKKLTDGASHTIHILLQPEEILLSVDDCHQSNCLKLGAPPNKDTIFLNTNGPLQVGGTRDDLTEVARVLGWTQVPSSKGFVGCVRNLTFNGKTYNLGSPGEYKNAYASCNYATIGAATFSIDSSFIVAILVCIAILIILFLAVVVHRRKQDNWNEKDSDDICENIINYEDEGGGEVDTGFDMSVLRGEHLEDKLPISDGLYRQEAPEVPDINGFLSGKKDICDRDPSNLPYDDVRHYAYEGLGNSDGSLSSLASCTDDGDLKFNYLSNFGPRFRKLADMYGEDPSDDGSQDGGEESWC